MKRQLTPMALACAALALQVTARAQTQQPEAPAQAAPGQLETVTVTVQRRSEVLSKAPVAVSVISQKGLDAQGITSIADIPSTVPNLQLAGNGFAMRGIGNNNAFGGYSTVAVQVDGIYEPAYQVLTVGMYDIDRIEALRGPQGTVYGRNATAGVVNVETARPNAKFAAFGDLAYGTDRDVTARGVLNLPLSDTFQVRLSALKRKNDGSVDGGAAPRNYQAVDVSSVRLAWAWQASPDIRWRASLSNAQDKGTVQDAKLLSYNYYSNANLAAGTQGQPTFVAPVGSILGYHTPTDNSKNLKQNAFRSSLTWALTDEWSVTYLAGATQLVNNGFDTTTGLFAVQNKDWTTRTQSHEIDVNYESSGLKVVGGLYHYRDKTRGAQKIAVGDAIANPYNNALPGFLYFERGVGFAPSALNVIDVAKRTNRDSNDSDAVFTQAAWSVLPTLRLTAGVRYTRDKFSTDGDSQVCAPGSVAAPNFELSCGVPFGPPGSAVATAKSSNTSWRLGADYDLSKDDLLFASVSTGYRGGGATANVAAEFLTYKPETLTNIEIGWRARMLKNTLSLNVTAFNMDYRDLQVSTIGRDVGGNNTPVTGNASTARVRGLEFEGDWLVSRNDRLQGFFTYLDAHFGRFLDPVATAYNPATYNSLAPNFGATPAAPVGADNSGHRLQNAPKLALRGRYSHSFVLGDGARITPSAQLYWQSGTYTSLENFSDPARGYRKAYSKVDLGLGYESSDRRLTADLYVYNAGNERVYAGATALHAGTTVSYMPLRTVGVRVGYRFD